MNVFLSWSGDRSEAVAELLDGWLQCVIQAVDPWMSSKDIDRGTLWFSEVNDQLQNTSIGIICLTQENKIKPWILFEAGALAKGLSENRVCTFLIDLESTDIGAPLSQFNHTSPTKESLWGLVRTLNNSLKEQGLKEKILEQVFNTYWPQFEREFKIIIDENPENEVVVKRTDDDILLEILTATRSMNKRVRLLEQEAIRDIKEINNYRISEKNIDYNIKDIYKNYCDLISVGIPEDDAILNISKNYKIDPNILYKKFERFYPKSVFKNIEV
jgi:hypothetical protein